MAPNVAMLLYIPSAEALSTVYPVSLVALSVQVKTACNVAELAVATRFVGAATVVPPVAPAIIG